MRFIELELILFMTLGKKSKFTLLSYEIITAASFIPFLPTIYRASSDRFPYMHGSVPMLSLLDFLFVFL